MLRSLDRRNVRKGLWLCEDGQGTGHVVGSDFTLADIVSGLSTHRWFGRPMKRPDLPAVSACCERLKRRPGFQRHGAGP